jgi:hypothetical protein
MHAADQMKTECSHDARPSICNNIRGDAKTEDGGRVAERLPLWNQSVPVKSDRRSRHRYKVYSQSRMRFVRLPWIFSRVGASGSRRFSMPYKFLRGDPVRLLQISFPTISTHKSGQGKISERKGTASAVPEVLAKQTGFSRRGTAFPCDTLNYPKRTKPQRLKPIHFGASRFPFLLTARKRKEAIS